MAEFSSAHDPQLLLAHSQFLELATSKIETHADTAHILPCNESVAYTLGGWLVEQQTGYITSTQLFVVRHEFGSSEDGDSITEVFLKVADPQTGQPALDRYWLPMDESGAQYIYQPSDAPAQEALPMQLSFYATLQRLLKQTCFTPEDTAKGVRMFRPIYDRANPVDMDTFDAGQLCAEFPEEFARNLAFTRHWWRGEPTGR